MRGIREAFIHLVHILGQILELLGEQPDNEHWWKVKDEDGQIGCVPASYVLKKEHQVQSQSRHN